MPLLLYFHENQLAYPVRVDDRRDEHYAWTNVQSAAAADRVLWNSAYNRDSFLTALPEFLRRLPAPRLPGLVEQLRARSTVLPVPAALAELAARRARGAGGPAAHPVEPPLGARQGPRGVLRRADRAGGRGTGVQRLRARRALRRHAADLRRGA
ncbi:MAG: DUF3524 domain-containing protein [Candidatus Latescibacteria bacterium]|nr:DUF3524 domain-containing protein [Candidatus Latescibacterota bacterium]